MKRLELAAKALATLAALLATLSGTADASAQSIIKNDASHDHGIELEPHGILSPWDAPRGPADVGLGGGLFVGINLAPKGFLPQVNDSVSLGISADFVQYFGGGATTGQCVEWRPVGGSQVCVRTNNNSGSPSYIFLPAVMQWNFYLSRDFSVFGEPGLSAYTSFGGTGAAQFGITPVFNAGGRWHFSEKMTLNARIGYPYTTIGVGFLL